MTYAEIKQRVYDILDLPPEEIVRLQYSTKIPKIFNEATLRMAHSVLPNLREYVVKFHRDRLSARFSMPPDFVSFANEQDAYLDNKPFTLSQFIGAQDVIVTGYEVAGYTPGDIVEYRIFYNASYATVDDPEESFRRVKIFAEPVVDSENYIVETADIDDVDIPILVGTAIPYYIAGQLLSRDDKVRATECLNEFEILMSVYNTDRNSRTKEYRSVKGWY